MMLICFENSFQFLRDASALTQLRCCGFGPQNRKQFSSQLTFIYLYENNQQLQPCKA